MVTRIVFFAFIGIIGCGPVREGPAPSTPTNSTLDVFVELPRFYDADDALYQGIVAKVLGENGFVGSCFTMVSLIEGKPEEAVYGQCPGDSHSATVVHVVANQSIAHTIRAQGVQGALSIQVRRSETTITADDARALRASWLKVLSSARVETGTALRESRREHFFYVLRPGLFQGFIAGVSRNPKRDGVAARFVEVGEHLVDVVDASESEREEKLQTLRRALNRVD